MITDFKQKSQTYHARQTTSARFGLGGYSGCGLVSLDKVVDKEKLQKLLEENAAYKIDDDYIEDIVMFSRTA